HDRDARRFVAVQHDRGSWPLYRGAAWLGGVAFGQNIPEAAQSVRGRRVALDVEVELTAWSGIIMPSLSGMNVDRQHQATHSSARMIHHVVHHRTREQFMVADCVGLHLRS